jgi:ATP-dependent DNA helicase RecG
VLKTDLLQLIANGENSGVEFKSVKNVKGDEIRAETLGKAIVALANLRGGVVLLGVDDDGTVSGIQPTRHGTLERWVMDTVLGHYVHPAIIPFYEEVVLDAGLRVAVITVTQGTQKPYVLRSNGREEVYVRVGAISKLATRDQQAQLFASGGMLHSEVLPVSGSSLADLDRDRLSDYLVTMAGDPVPPATEPEWEQRLLGLGFLASVPDREPVCTMAGLVLFGRSPRRTMRQAGVRWMSFAGTEMDYQAQDDLILDGPLVALWRGGDGQPRERVEDGLLERVLSRMGPFIALPQPELQDGLRRESQPRYPPEAIREALLNALVHRDWTRSTQVEIVNYRDRLEVTSPGRLQNSMTVDKVLAGQRSARNGIIVDVMRDYGYVDHRGMGVRRKIVPQTRALTGQDARFEETDDYFRVTLPARLAEEDS